MYRMIVRKITAVALLLAMLACVPAVYADGAVLLPDKWEAPSNIILEDISNTELEYLYNFTLRVSYDKGEDLMEFLSLSDAQRKSAYGAAAETIRARVQIDWAVDDYENRWIYDQFRQEWDTLTSTNSSVWDYSGSAESAESLTAEKTETVNILNLYSNNDAQWLESGLQERVGGYVYTLKDAFGIDVSLIDLNVHTIYVKMRYIVEFGDNTFVYSDWSETAAIGKDAPGAADSGADDKEEEPIPSEEITVTWSAVSGWAAGTVEEAAKAALYPAVLHMEDLTRPITRREFAGIVVCLLEQLGLPTAPAQENPFSDTRDTNVLKAYNAGILYGRSATVFCPMENISREETAVTLERVCQKAADAGIMQALSNQSDERFADDGDIALWAKDAVYRMQANAIMEGVGDHCFAPKAPTASEQALALALRIYNFGR